MWDELMKDKDKLQKINDTAFSMIDADNNCQIEKNELHDILAMTAEEMGIEKPSKEETKEIMKTLDTESKGYLSKQTLFKAGRIS